MKIINKLFVTISFILLVVTFLGITSVYADNKKQEQYLISGKITTFIGDKPISAVGTSVKITNVKTGKTTSTEIDKNGSYKIITAYKGLYSILPLSSLYRFLPILRLENVQRDETGLNFKAVRKLMNE